jgi:hypothetical protein
MGRKPDIDSKYDSQIRKLSAERRKSLRRAAELAREIETSKHLRYEKMMAQITDAIEKKEYLYAWGQIIRGLDDETNSTQRYRAYANKLIEVCKEVGDPFAYDRAIEEVQALVKREENLAKMARKKGKSQELIKDFTNAAKHYLQVVVKLEKEAIESEKKRKEEMSKLEALASGGD